MAKQTNQLKKNYHLENLLFFWGMGVLLTATSVDSVGIKPFIIAGSVAVVVGLLLTLLNYIKDRKTR